MELAPTPWRTESIRTGDWPGGTVE